MRTAIAYIGVALVLFAAGLGLWMTGRFEQRIVDARQQILTLDYGATLPDVDDLDESLVPLAKVPWIADRVATIRHLRAVSTYWQQGYPQLALQRDAGGASVEQDPALLRLAANAAFRDVRVNAADRAAAQKLNDVLGAYVEVLRRTPDFDAAFNYEFVARTRDALTRSKAGGSAPARKPDTKPGEHTIHGEQGAPPDAANMGQFKVIIPQRSDERSQQPDAGSGVKKQRKG